jgi:ATP-dependent DNA helicase RecQ
MVHYAESAGCRRAEILGYFGEAWPGHNCGACDNCLEPREAMDGTVPAQKLLSCIVRIQRASGFSAGLGHVVDVLAGADTEKVRRWGHDRLSTYGIGADLSRQEWTGIGRELLRLGLLEVSAGEYATLSLTAAGEDALRLRRPISLTRPMATPPPSTPKPRVRRAGEIECDEILFEHLRKLRKRLADERNVPAYVVCGDATLREMARRYPADTVAMEGISGLGEKRRAEYGALFAAAIRDYLAANSRLAFAE